MGNVLSVCSSRPRQDPVKPFSARKKKKKLPSNRTNDLPPVETVDSAKAPPNDSDDTNDAPMFDPTENLAHISVYLVKEAKLEDTVINLKEQPSVEEVTADAEASSDDTTNELMFDALDNLELNQEVPNNASEDHKEKLSIFERIRRFFSCFEPKNVSDVYLVKEANPENRVVNIKEMPVVDEVATNAEASTDDTTDALMFDASKNLGLTHEDSKEKKMSIFSKIRRLLSRVSTGNNVSNGNVYLVKEAKPEDKVVNFQELSFVEEFVANAEASTDDTNDNNLEHHNEDGDKKKKVSIFGKIRRSLSCVATAKNVSDVYLVKEAKPENRVVNIQELPVAEVTANAEATSENLGPEIEDDLDVLISDLEAVFSQEEKTKEANNKLDELSDRITGNKGIPTSALRCLAHDLAMDSDNLALRPRRPPTRYGVNVELGLAYRNVDRELPSLFGTIAQMNTPDTPLIETIAKVNRYRQLKLFDNRVRLANCHEPDLMMREDDGDEDVNNDATED